MICKGNHPLNNVIEIDEEIVWGSPIQILTFNVDINTVVILLKELFNGTNGNTCIKII